MTSTIFYSSAYSSLSTADVAASAAGGSLVIDSNITLASAVTINTKQVVFAGGIITLGSYDLTFNGSGICAGATQIFDTSNSGKVKGTINGDICFDWWGTTSATYADPATTNAINAAFDYIVQSANPSCTVHGYRPTYLLSDTVTKPFSVFCPNIDFHGAIIQSDFSSAKPAMNIIGQSGNPALATISNIQFEATTENKFRSIGLQIVGQCGLEIERVKVRQHAYSFVLLNNAPGVFTEGILFKSCASASAITLRYQRLNGGDSSFHGSGLEHCGINPAANIDAQILVDDGAFVYNSPMTFEIFPTSTTYPIIRTGTDACWISYGDITIENFWGSGAVTVLATTSSKAHTHTGGINCWGGPFAVGDLVLYEDTYLLGDGVIRGRKKGFQPPAVSVAGSTTLIRIATTGSQSYLLNVFLNLPNYGWKGIVAVTSDPFGNNSAAVIANMITGGANYSAWGPPLFGWDGNNLSVTNSHFGSGGQVDVSATDLGDFF